MVLGLALGKMMCNLQVYTKVAGFISTLAILVDCQIVRQVAIREVNEVPREHPQLIMRSAKLSLMMVTPLVLYLKMATFQ